MKALRRQIRRHFAFAWALIAAALLVKAIVPAGYMTVVSDGTITVQLCSGIQGKTMEIAMPGMKTPGKDHPAKADMPCPFAGLSAPSLAAVDAGLLVLAIAFILAAARREPEPVAPRRAPYLRPPLRGPPATA
ncbi:DUF2946 family protein [Sphingomonas immobilis]|uniref:DUF2946 domain-containing protein n=1 Tax=Sphingomonas immobilis TaxID=3063997 RepID=A0ABT9A048_9SPHN|nr:DUF2946 family protein [Sphingomonas sp. CA1-15]MDO7843210.1 hypothetical protein [Sphingomonas sp. CA1-15]